MTRPSTLLRTGSVALLCLLLAGCPRNAEDRALRDQDIGHAAGAGIAVDVAGGLGHIRSLDNATISLWAQAPVLDVTVDLAAAGTWTITVDNALADLDATAGALAVTTLPTARPTLRSWSIDLPAGTTAVHIAPPDADDGGPWRFAVMGDIQTAMPTVHEVFARINAEPDIRFVVSTGDITDRGREPEYEMFEEKLLTLNVPFYSTIGNHELWGDIDRWYVRFGRATVYFDFRRVAFAVVDSAGAGIDPITNDELDAWLAAHPEGLSFFFTHYPPLDPLGVRQGSFASRREAQQLLARLAAGGIDTTFYGHLHTHASFENAGMPAEISGGGGADPMAFDGIDRHFLTVDVFPAANTIIAIDVVRVD
jgi:3',5'-cyclic-AMP phosphodiesterase